MCCARRLRVFWVFVWVSVGFLSLWLCWRGVRSECVLIGQWFSLPAWSGPPGSFSDSDCTDLSSFHFRPLVCCSIYNKLTTALGLDQNCWQTTSHQHNSTKRDFIPNAQTKQGFCFVQQCTCLNHTKEAQSVLELLIFYFFSAWGSSSGYANH